MSISWRWLALFLALSLPSGCAPPAAPRQATVAPLSIAKKQEYIRIAKATLRNFQAAAIDLRERGKSAAMREIAGEVKSYIALQVKPILEDVAAVNDLQTRLEVAKLQLMCGMVCVELGEYREAHRQLEKLQRRYGSHPDVLNAAIDRNDIGFVTLESGMQNLQERIERETPVRRLLPPLTALSAFTRT